MLVHTSTWMGEISRVNCVIPVTGSQQADLESLLLNLVFRRERHFKLGYAMLNISTVLNGSQNSENFKLVKQLSMLPRWIHAYTLVKSIN